MLTEMQPAVSTDVALRKLRGKTRCEVGMGPGDGRLHPHAASAHRVTETSVGTGNTFCPDKYTSREQEGHSGTFPQLLAKLAKPEPVLDSSLVVFCLSRAPKGVRTRSSYKTSCNDALDHISADGSHPVRFQLLHGYVTSCCDL